ncbi:MAG: phosphoglycerate dehydrogenase [Magnetovibrionaceae bacterium]
MARILITTIPFGERDVTPLRLLEDAGHEVVINPLGRKLVGEELGEIVGGFDAVIAGTETINASIMDKADRLKLISRVGIGLDSVDLLAARERDIAVAYTPDGPTAAVSELTIGLMIDLLRGVSTANRDLGAGTWKRIMGRRIAEVTVGVIGVGRIGRRVINHLQGGFPGVKILANDLKLANIPGVDWTSKKDIYARADVVTLHLPLTAKTRHLIGEAELSAMKPDAVLINTARGGIVDEAALSAALTKSTIAGAAIDVFEEEPYAGPLAGQKGAIVTCHMGSMSEDCRARMEKGACEEAVRFFEGKGFLNPVPESEYEIARGLK